MIEDAKKIVMTQEELQEWINCNLIRASEAMEITKQSKSAFTQSLKLGRLKPYYSNTGSGESRKISLYLKSDVEAYALQVVERRKRLVKKGEK